MNLKNARCNNKNNSNSFFKTTSTFTTNTIFMAVTVIKLRLERMQREKLYPIE
jgi:hypothetical protein